MNLIKILSATKFDELTLEAIKSLLDLKRAGMEEIILTHIIPCDEVAFVPCWYRETRKRMVTMTGQPPKREKKGLTVDTNCVHTNYAL